MTRPLGTRPRPEEAQVLRSMKRTRPLPSYPRPTLLARQAATLPISCVEGQTFTTSIYTTTLTRALPLSTSTFQRFITDSQTDKTTTITQAIVEAGQRTTIEALPVTTTFCIPQVISSAPTATSSTLPSIGTTSITTSSSSASSTSNSSATSSSSATSQSPHHRPNKTPAIVAAAVVPAIVFIIVMGLVIYLRGRKGKKQKKEDAVGDSAAIEAMKAEDRAAEADRTERSGNQPPTIVPLRGGFTTQEEMNGGQRFGQRGAITILGWGPQLAGHQHRRQPMVLQHRPWGRLPATPFAQEENRNQQRTQQGLFQQGGPPGETQQRGPQAWHQQEGPPGSDQQRRSQAINIQAGLPGVLDLGTTLPGAGAPSTVLPDDSISVVLRTNSPEIVDHTLDDNSQLSTSRDHALALLEGVIPENLATNRSNWRPRDPQEELERARLQKERGRKHEAGERRRREEFNRAQEIRRRLRNSGQTVDIRGLGVTDTNQTDFDIDAVNREQANLPPRRRQDGHDNNRPPFAGPQEYGGRANEVEEDRIYPPMRNQTWEQNRRRQERELFMKGRQHGIGGRYQLNRHYAADFGEVAGPAPQPKNLRDLSSSNESRQGPQAMAYRGPGVASHRRNRFPLLGEGLDEVDVDEVDEDEPTLFMGPQTREELTRLHLGDMDRRDKVPPPYAPREATTGLGQSFNSTTSNSQERDNYLRDMERSGQAPPPYTHSEATTEFSQSFNSARSIPHARANDQRQEERQVIPFYGVYSSSNPAPQVRANVNHPEEDLEADDGRDPQMTEQEREEARLERERDLMDQRLRNDGSWLDLSSDDHGDQDAQDHRKE